MIPKVIEIPDFSQKNDVSNEDIQSKYDNLYKERNHEYENMNQSIPIKQQFRTSNNFQISQNLNENIKKNNNPTNKQPINEFISSSDFNPNIELSITNIELSPTINPIFAISPLLILLVSSWRPKWT